MSRYEHPDLPRFYRRGWQARKAWLARHGFIKRLAYCAGVFLFLASLAAMNLSDHHKAQAISQVNAVDELGQVDGSDQPIWNQSGWNNNSGSPNAQGFEDAISTEVDSVHHRLFVADRSNARVLIFNLDSNNQLIDHTADFVLGEPDFTTVDSTCSSESSTTASQICDPSALAYDPVNDRLFVGDDVYDTRVLVFDLSGGISNDMPASNVLGAPNLTTFGNGCTAAISNDNFCSPDGLGYDSKNKRLFVDDYGLNRIVIYDLSGGISDGMAASWVLGQTDFSNNSYNCAVTSATEACNLQGDLAYDTVNDYLFVGEFDDNRVLVFDMSGGISNNMAASWVLGQTDFISTGHGATQTQLWTPTGLAYDSASKRLFVEDSGNNRVMEYDLSGGVSSGMAANMVFGQPDFNTNGSGLSQQSLDNPVWGLAYDPVAGHLYVTDNWNDRIMVFKVGLAITTTSLPGGQTGNSYSGSVDVQDQSGATTFTITSGALPPGITIDGSTGALSGTPTANGTYVFTVQVDDQGGETASKSLSIGIGNGYMASDLLGQLDGSNNPIWNQSGPNNNNGGTPTKGGLNYPEGTVVDTTRHRLYVEECSNSRVSEYDLDSNNNLIDRQPDHVLGQPDFSTYDPSGGDNRFNGCGAGLSFDQTRGRLFVPDEWPPSSRILVFDVSGTIIDGMAASYVIGQPDFNTLNDYCGYDAPSGTVTNNGICDLYGGTVYDPATNYLYAGDSGNARVLVFDLNSIANGLAASYVIGQPDFTSHANKLTQDGLGYPYGMALDSANHHLFVADWSSAGRVMVYDTSALANGMNASYVLGEADFTSNNSASDNGDPPDAKSFGPSGLNYDSRHGYLYVKDDNSYRTMIFDVNSLSNNEDAIGVLGVPSLSDTGSCGVSQISMCDMEGQTDFFDTANNRLYVSDSGNNRVMIYNFVQIATNSLPNGTTGSGYSQTINQTGGQGNISYSLVSGSLPNGLNLNTSTGDITGTPTQTGSFSFTVTVSDDNGGAGIFTDSKVLGMNVSAGGSDTQVPTVPTGLHVTGTTTGSISLAWNTASDNVGVQGYYVYRDGGGTPIGSAAGTSYTDSGLSPGTTHTYTVTAYDAAANESGHSSQVAGTTLSVSGGGTSNGGSSGSGSSGSTVPPSAPAAPPASSPINLDSFPPVNSRSACADASSVSAGQIFTFTAKDGSAHKITVLQIGADSIVLDIDGLPRTLHVGDLIGQDVNGDGTEDICVDVIAITGGKADLKIDRIIVATSPVISNHNNGFGGGNTQTPPQIHKTPHWLQVAVYVFPWLLFILLGSSAARLLFLAYQERRAAALLEHQLALETQLAEEKHNFVTLSSHYLRTPVTAISNGIELVASLQAGRQTAGLKDLSGRLRADVNDLLAKASNRAPAELQNVQSGLITPLRTAFNSAAGFIQINSVRAIGLAVGGSFAAVGLADLILHKVDLYNIPYVNQLIQLAAILLAAVLLTASVRRHNRNKAARERAGRLLAQQQELDHARNTLITNSLQELKPVLNEIRSKLAASGADRKILRPAMEGIAQLDSLLGKFTILASLETGAMQARKQNLDIGQLAGQTAARYENVLKSKGLKLDNSVPSRTSSQDPLLLTFVLDSLLSNAIKYSPPNGQIHVSSSGNSISVSDQGTGVSPDKQAELFQPFSRAEDTARDFNVQGAGLSLYLDRLIMRYLGGDIDIDSQPGHGTTVSFGLPA